jgi:hypothetical protein
VGNSWENFDFSNISEVRRFLCIWLFLNFSFKSFFIHCPLRRYVLLIVSFLLMVWVKYIYNLYLIYSLAYVSGIWQVLRL